MIPTINKALAHPHFQTVSRDDVAGIFKVRIGELRTVITITVIKLEIDRYKTSESHAIRTDLQAMPYKARKWPYDYAGEALAEALSAYAFFYSIAVSQGCEPNDSWLVPIPDDEM